MIVTRSEYAKLCGVSRQAISLRIQAGTLGVVALEVPAGKNTTGVDTSTYPPKRLETGRGARSKNK